LAGNPIFPPKHQLRGHKEEDCHVFIKTSQRRLLEPSQPHKQSHNHKDFLRAMLLPKGRTFIYVM
jgi:hypothetical protein